MGYGGGDGRGTGGREGTGFKSFSVSKKSFNFFSYMRNSSIKGVSPVLVYVYVHVYMHIYVYVHVYMFNTFTCTTCADAYQGFEDAICPVFSLENEWSLV